jgi:uncharacterized protein (DUF983 family)
VPWAGQVWPGAKCGAGGVFSGWVGKRAACWICRNELEEYPKDAHIPIDVRAFISFLASAGLIESEEDAEVYIEDTP